MGGQDFALPFPFAIAGHAKLGFRAVPSRARTELHSCEPLEHLARVRTLIASTQTLPVARQSTASDIVQCSMPGAALVEAAAR